MVIFCNFTGFISELRLTEKKEEEEAEKDKMDIFATGLLGYAKNWKSVEGRFII